MVRTYPVVPLRFDPARIAAWSTAIALHVLAFMLLVIPAAYVAAPLPREAPQIRWITPDKPLPPTPVPPEVVQQVAPPQTVVKPQPTHLPTPTTVTEQVPAYAVPAAEPQPAPVPSVPLQTATPTRSGPGVQLRYRSAPPPAYPIAALRGREQGTVLLRVEVSAEGRPTAVSIERSSGSRALDLAARQQVLRQWRFEPSMQDGVATSSVGLVPIEFSLPE
ncbi:TonB family protein [Stenotrophomonas sp. CFBP 13724]|uniref:energy transducer TonB n=1 Tax=Stenotrophomonas sp. CFBP 13724 TaxID=2775298 RepID=UPI0017840BBB|nr:energy transducer TonB [Stenotrophomonas sp. CFBP 13724]MBD8642591.1 TonB family protein [Stenotrophomonas sp. CFBP 13724]